MKFLKHLFLFLVITALVLPYAQTRYHIFNIQKLSGVFPSEPKAKLDSSAWWSGKYQEQQAKYIEENIGMRNILVRTYNQVDFSLFSVPHATKVVVGKDNYLYGSHYIYSYLGQDFIGKKFIDENTRKIRTLQDLLWETRKIRLLVIFAPEKGSFYPEYIPDYLLKKKKEITNYQYSIKKCEENGVNFIDFNRWFRMIKDTSKNVLYSKTGIHWSVYGAVIAADSMRNYLSAKFGLPMPEIVRDGLEKTNVARSTDDDINQTLNLICDIPQPELSYLKYHFTDIPGEKKPGALFIGDSFYWTIYNAGMIENLFWNSEFWYYDKEVYPESNTEATSTFKIDIRKAITRQNIIILLQTNAAYGNIGYGFVDQALAELDTVNSELNHIERSIRENATYMEFLRKKAADRHMTLDEMVRIDARYLMNQQELKKIKNKKIYGIQ
jgi:hypothetical protein